MASVLSVRYALIFDMTVPLKMRLFSVKIESSKPTRLEFPVSFPELNYKFNSYLQI